MKSFLLYMGGLVCFIIVFIIVGLSFSYALVCGVLSASGCCFIIMCAPNEEKEKDTGVRSLKDEIQEK